MAFKNIGKAIAVLRRQRGLSQAELADACGLGRAQLSRYEAGRELMKLPVLERILQGLALGPADFFRTLESLDDSPSPARRERAQDDSLTITQACEQINAAVDDLREGIGILCRVVAPAAHLAAMISNAAVAEDEAVEP
jgi:transcriptional regulator with XRE-family HTH domain